MGEARHPHGLLPRTREEIGRAAVHWRQVGTTDPQKGVDYYMEGELLVFTAHYLLKRGYCCNSGCRHCPYGKLPAPEVAVKIIGIDTDDED